MVSPIEPRGLASPVCLPPSAFRLPFFVLLLLIGSFNPSLRADQLVADTPALSPAEQQAKFHLPPGFEIQLVAAEPDINKPRNMSFDVHGRLWVSHTIEYPFAAKSDEVARDAITLFSEFDASGRAKKVHKFADHLNIPTGLLPLSDREALAWSIPHIYRLIDTNGDGVADQRKAAFGPFGFRDTHGNQNAFTRWIDGWVYANHGFFNDSHIKLGGEGEVVLHMHSGNTYRFRSDGSMIEQFAWGQVNPYGLSFDRLGNLYAADCHSRPVTMLLRGGYYQSFGKPHDGLGFAPETTTIDHGGTGIAGIVYNALPGWPAKYRDVLLVGNVISNRVHCDRLKWTGSTPVVKKVEDFITCDDPWFRPVDIQQGPDGALYIADYYNCIIGHYEVPLTHPKRDRERGRVWRVVYTGEGAIDPATVDLAALNAEQLAKLLESENLIVRTQATNELFDRFGKDAASKTGHLLDANAPADATVHALWIAARRGQLNEQLARQLADDPRPVVRVHLVRALGEMPDWQLWRAALVRGRISDADPFVRRNVAEALAKHPSLDNLQPLLQLLSEAPADDACLVHSTRIALRDHLRGKDIRLEELAKTLSPVERKALLKFVATAPTASAAAFIVDEAFNGNVSDELLIEAIPTAARELDSARIDALADHVVRRFADRPDMRLVLLCGIGESLISRNIALSGRLKAPLVELLKAVFASDDRALWVNLPLPQGPVTISPWVVQKGWFTDEHATMPLISSQKERSPIGERLGGILRSPEFVLPPKFSFWMCGHNGPPKEKDKQTCYIRLRLTDGVEVARSYPPRDDAAHPYSWDLASHAGKRGYLELVDGATVDPKYGYIAAGRFHPETVLLLPTAPVGDASDNRAKLLKVIGQLRLNELAGDVEALANDAKQTADVRVAASECLAAVKPEASVVPLAAVLSDAKLPIGVREQSAQQLGQLGSQEAQAALVAAMKSAPQTLAVQIAAGLAARAESAAALLAEVSAGRASPTLLREPAVANRLKSCGLKDADKQVAELTANLSPADNRIAKLIESRRQGFLATKPDAEAGRSVFARSVCANCHRIGEVGKNVGPALDGIGSRGLDRLLEDILDPSRNVDQAFRTVMLATDGGEIISGFAAREEGPMTVLTDNKGEPVRVPNDEIVERKTITLSPMPTNAIEQIPPQDFNSLLAYLLSQQGKK